MKDRMSSTFNYLIIDNFKCFPGGAYFKKLTKEEGNKVVGAINNIPRKCLGWKTPPKVFLSVIECCI